MLSQDAPLVTSCDPNGRCSNVNMVSWNVLQVDSTSVHGQLTLTNLAFINPSSVI